MWDKFVKVLMKVWEVLKRIGHFICVSFKKLLGNIPAFIIYAIAYIIASKLFIFVPCPDNVMLAILIFVLCLASVEYCHK